MVYQTNVVENSITVYFAKWAPWCSLRPDISAPLLCSPRVPIRLVWLRVRVGDLCRLNFQKSIGEVEDERAAELHQLRVQAVSPLGSLGKRRCGRGLWAEVGWLAAKLVHMAARRTNLQLPVSLV